MCVKMESTVGIIICHVSNPLAIGAILGSDGSMQVVAKPNGITCALPSLPGMAQMANGMGRLQGTYCLTPQLKFLLHGQNI